MKIGIKAGTFFLGPHAGHIFALSFAKSLCDKLIVLINDNEYVKNKKGYIAIDQEDRKIIMQALKPVDEVHIFKGDTEDNWVRNYVKYNAGHHFIMFHSEETENKKHVPCSDIVDEVIFIKRIPGSTSEIIKKIKHGSK